MQGFPVGFFFCLGNDGLARGNGQGLDDALAICLGFLLVFGYHDNGGVFYVGFHHFVRRHGLYARGGGSSDGGRYGSGKQFATYHELPLG